MNNEYHVTGTFSLIKIILFSLEFLYPGIVPGEFINF